jgi:hypothetical protein
MISKSDIIKILDDNLELDHNNQSEQLIIFGKEKAAEAILKSIGEKDVI